MEASQCFFIGSMVGSESNNSLHSGRRFVCILDKAPMYFISLKRIDFQNEVKKNNAIDAERKHAADFRMFVCSAMRKKVGT
jgi:hypothetical protein